MRRRVPVVLGIATAVFLTGSVAACSSTDREAAEPSTAPAPVESASATASAGALFMDGSRICLINRSRETFTIEPLVYQEKSAGTTLNPGGDYCQAGYVEGDTPRSGDTDLKATNQGTVLRVYAENAMGFSPYAVVKETAQGNYEHSVLFSEQGVGEHKTGTTLNGRFSVDLYRVKDCCGWKQWRLEISDAPTE